MRNVKFALTLGLILVVAFATLVLGSGKNVGFPSFYNMSFVQTNSSFLFYSVNFTGASPAYSGNSSFHNALDNKSLTFSINHTTTNITSANFTLNGAANASLTCGNFGCLGSIVTAKEGVNQLVVYLENLSTGAVDAYTASNFTNASNVGRKETFIVDTVTPTIDHVTFHTSVSGGLNNPLKYNFTSFENNNTVSFTFNVTDNYTAQAWVILSQSPVGSPLQSNDTPRMMTNVTYTKIFSPTGSMNITSIYSYNVTDLNISSNFTGPGPHHLYFCVNDSANNAVCTSPIHYSIRTVNVTDLEKNFPAGYSGGAATLNVTFENGTEIGNVSYLDSATNNFTMEITPAGAPAGMKLSIVGLTVNETLIKNFNLVNTTTNPTSKVQGDLGSGFNATLMFLDVSSFLPSSSFYKFGKLTMPGTDYDVVKYCSGALASTSCTPISQCNTTSINWTNHDKVIPTGSACWLAQSGNIVIYSDTFSGAVGGNDTQKPAFKWSSPVNESAATVLGANNSANISDSTPFINFTLYDINGTGIDIGVNGRNSNNTINVTFLKFTQANISGNATECTANVIDKKCALQVNLNFTCTAVDSSSTNATRADCTFTAPQLPDGNVTMNVTFIDASNNSNYNSTQVTFVVDTKPPRFSGAIDLSHGESKGVRNIFVLNDTYISGSQNVMLVRLNVSDNSTSTRFVKVDGVNLVKGPSQNTLNYLSGYELWNGSVTLSNLSSVADGSTQNLSIYVEDAVGNWNSTLVTYVVDKTAPVLNTVSFTNGRIFSSATGAVYFNYTVTETNLSYSQVDIDGGLVQKNTTNSSGNAIVQLSTNVGAGLHRVTFTMVDNASHKTLAFRNFTMMTTITGSDVTNLINQTSGGVTLVTTFINANRTNATGVQLDHLPNISSAESFFPNLTLGLKFTSNGTNNREVNGTLFMFFDGSSVDWNATKSMSIQFNDTANGTEALTRIYGAVYNGSNSTYRYKHALAVQNASFAFGDDLRDNTSNKLWQFVYFPRANMSLSNGASYKNNSVVYADDDFGGNARILPACGTLVNNLPSTTPSVDNACYVQGPANWSKNLGLGHDTGVMVFVPHFSVVAIVDNSAGPKINLTSPNDRFGTHNDSALTIQGLIWDLNLNTSSCSYELGFQNGTAIKGNTSFIPTPAFSGSANYSFSVTDNTLFKQLRNNTITIGVYCSSLEVAGDAGTANKTSSLFKYTITDNTKPIVPVTPEVSVTGTTALITYAPSEFTNNTLFLGTSSSIMTLQYGNTSFLSSWELGLSGLTASTVYFYNLTICDVNNNCNTVGPFSFTTSAASGSSSSSSGGSGGGGGGGAILQRSEKGTKVSTMFSVISAGVSQVFNINNAAIPLIKIVFSVNERLSLVDMAVISLDKMPSGVSEPDAEVFKYIEIDAPKLTESLLKEAKISFRASKDWISKNNVNPESVVLARYANNAWTKLPTKNTGQDANSVNFEATTPGFSYFAILGGEKAKDLLTPEEAKEAADKEIESGDEQKETTSSLSDDGSNVPDETNWSLILLIVVVLGIAGYFVYNKMN